MDIDEQFIGPMIERMSKETKIITFVLSSFSLLFSSLVFLLFSLLLSSVLLSFFFRLLPDAFFFVLIFVSFSSASERRTEGHETARHSCAFDFPHSRPWSAWLPCKEITINGKKREKEKGKSGEERCWRKSFCSWLSYHRGKKKKKHSR